MDSILYKIDKLLLDEGIVDPNKKLMIKKKKSGGFESWTYYHKGATRGGTNRSSSPITMQDFDSVADAEKWGKKNGWNVKIVESYFDFDEGGTLDEGTVRYVSPRDLPDWVQRVLKGKKIGKDVAVEVGDRVVTSGNWHDANVMDVYLYDRGKVAHQMAIGGQSPWDTGKEAQVKKGFETTLNKDKMILITNTYPKTAKLYVHPDAMIKALDEPKQQLTPEEYMVLAITRGLKAAYAGGYPRKDTSAEYGIDYDTVKNQLISKGMLNRAGAINKNGKNALASAFDNAFVDYHAIAKKFGMKSKRWG